MFLITSCMLCSGFPTSSDFACSNRVQHAERAKNSNTQNLPKTATCKTYLNWSQTCNIEFSKLVVLQFYDFSHKLVDTKDPMHKDFNF